jgi:hypothetical protein
MPTQRRVVGHSQHMFSRSLERPQRGRRARHGVTVIDQRSVNIEDVRGVVRYWFSDSDTLDAE